MQFGIGPEGLIEIYLEEQDVGDTRNLEDRSSRALQDSVFNNDYDSGDVPPNPESPDEQLKNMHHYLVGRGVCYAVGLVAATIGAVDMQYLHTGNNKIVYASAIVSVVSEAVGAVWHLSERDLMHEIVTDARQQEEQSL